MRPRCCHRSPRDLQADNNIRAHGAGAMPTSLHPSTRCSTLHIPSSLQPLPEWIIFDKPSLNLQWKSLMKQNRKVHAEALPHFSFYNNRIWCSGMYTANDDDGKIPGYFYTLSLCFIWSRLANASLLSVVNTAAAGSAAPCALIPLTNWVAPSCFEDSIHRPILSAWAQ